MSLNNITIVDYHNNNAGFIIKVDCNHVGASLIGEIMFKNINFSQETKINGKLRIDNFIHYSGPQNFTLKNSYFNLFYNELENLDAFKFEDNALCMPNDGLTQQIYILSNTFTYEFDRDDIYNNMKLNFFDISPRTYDIKIDSNKFVNMNDSFKPFIDWEFHSKGQIWINNNHVFNSSSQEYQFLVDSEEEIVMTNNTFIDCKAIRKGYLKVEKAQSIEVHQMVIEGSSHGDYNLPESLLYISVRFLRFNYVSRPLI